MSDSNYGPSLGDYERQVNTTKLTVNDAASRNIQLSRTEIMTVARACETVDMLRQSHHYSKWRMRNDPELSNISLLPDLCKNVIKHLYHAAETMEKLLIITEDPRRRLPSGIRTNLQLANNAFSDIHQAWQLFGTVGGSPELDESKEAKDLLKNYVVKALKMTLKVGSLVVPSYSHVWDAWQEDLDERPSLPGFTFDNSYRNSQSSNPSTNYLFSYSYPASYGSSTTPLVFRTPGATLPTIQRAYPQPSGSGTQAWASSSDLEDEN